MEMTITYLYSLLIRVEHGFTAKGNVSYHHIRIPYVREDATKEEITRAIDVMRITTAGEITDVWIETEKVTKVWGPEMRREKLENEGEELGVTQGQKVAMSASASPSAVNTTSTATTGVQATVGMQSTTAPASMTSAPVQAAAVVVGEEVRVPSPAVIPVPFRKPTTFAEGKIQKLLGSRRMQDAFSCDPVGHELDLALPEPTSNPHPTGSRKTTGMTAGGGGAMTAREGSGITAGEGTAPAKTGGTHALPGGSVMEKIRANGYRVRLEDIFRNPFAETVSNKGAPPTLEKIDVLQIYKDGP